MKKIVIFINSYNDVDNILPFIDYILLNNIAKIVLYKAKLSSLSSCKDHLDYLKNTYDLIPIDYEMNFSMFCKGILSAHEKIELTIKRIITNFTTKSARKKRFHKEKSVLPPNPTTCAAISCSIRFDYF